MSIQFHFIFKCLDKNRPYLTENPDRKEEFTVACRKVITAKIAMTTRNASEPHHADPAQPDDDTHNDVPNNDYHWKTSETNDSHQNWYNTKVSNNVISICKAQ